MKFDSKLKCTRIKRSEFNDIKFLYSISSCFIDFVSNIESYLIKSNIVNPNINRIVLNDIAYYLGIAVLNEYKYMKIED